MDGEEDTRRCAEKFKIAPLLQTSLFTVFTGDVQQAVHVLADFAASRQIGFQWRIRIVRVFGMVFVRFGIEGGAHRVRQVFQLITGQDIAFPGLAVCRRGSVCGHFKQVSEQLGGDGIRFVGSYGVASGDLGIGGGGLDGKHSVSSMKMRNYGTCCRVTDGTGSGPDFRTVFSVEISNNRLSESFMYQYVVKRIVFNDTQ